MNLHAASLAIYITVSFALAVEGALLQSKHGLRGSSRPQPDEVVNAASVTRNSTHAKDEVVHTANLTHNSTHQEGLSSLMGSTSYISCHVNPNGCAVNWQKIGAELTSQVVLFFGCSLDIYAVDYFCKAANAPIVGFSRGETTSYGTGNLAYCNVGGMILAFSFHPGVSGPPYFKACDDVLHGSCSGPVTTVNSATLIQLSVAAVVASFGRPPTSIIVDSSLWDVAAWYLRDGSPPEPYVAPIAHINYWCHTSYPTLMHAVQLASPTSKLAFRTAPRVEFMAGYGHSMANIDAMNACLRASALTSLVGYQVIDYNNLVERLLLQQGGGAAAYYDDAFHPGVLPSMVYIDWALQWVHATTLR